MGDVADRTGRDNYFEDFAVGLVIRHYRGKTVSALENVLITNLVLNTAQGHFNSDFTTKWGGRDVLVYGGVTLSIVLGLAAQDCCENALAEIGLDKVRFTAPVSHGDTLYAFSEVLWTDTADTEDAGRVAFRHYGFNQRDELVAQADRVVVLKRKSKWGDR
jgi:acyl dehydratase